MTKAAFDLGRLGIWSTMIRFGGDAGLAAAQELEALGYPAIWVPGGIDDGILAALDRLLDATSTIKFASGILNIWKHEPADVAAWFNAQSPERQGRIMLGLGVSHGPSIGDAWGKPVATMRAFLDGLDAAGMPHGHLCLAALGPKMVELSGERTAGAHPYIVSTEQVAGARAILGAGPLLAPELGAVLETDPAKARSYARGFLEHYARLPNYTNNWRRGGFSEAEIESLDDRLIDTLFAWGDVPAIQARIGEFHAAGADHVCVQVIGPGGMRADLGHDREVWKELAKLL